MSKLYTLRRSLQKPGASYYQKGRYLYTLAFLMLFSCFTAFGQTTISGTVKDAGGLAMPGVSIKVKGGQNGAVTDDNGKFSLKVDPKATLIFAYIGYLSKEVSVAKWSTKLALN